MKKPVPYYVSIDNTTPDEPSHGWYWTHENEDDEIVFHGPYFSRSDAEYSIENSEEMKNGMES